MIVKFIFPKNFVWIPITFVKGAVKNCENDPGTTGLKI